METKQETYIDKSSWARGPWDSEPDKMQFTDEATGLPCLVVRGPAGALCGYVGVSKGHPLYEVQYSDECPALAAALEKRKEQPLGETPGLMLMLGALMGDLSPRADVVLNVHGGLTFSGHCQEGGKICHEVCEGEDDNVWWLGFDCAHSGDLSPKYKQNYAEMMFGGEAYRDLDYVKREIAGLARQLVEIAPC